MRRSEIERIKAERLLGVLRRVVANPQNAEEVAKVLAIDWCPLIKVDEKGHVSFEVPGYNDL